MISLTGLGEIFCVSHSWSCLLDISPTSMVTVSVSGSPIHLADTVSVKIAPISGLELTSPRLRTAVKHHISDLVVLNRSKVPFQIMKNDLKPVN